MKCCTRLAVAMIAAASGAFQRSGAQGAVVEPPAFPAAEWPRFALTPRNTRLEILQGRRQLLVIAGVDTLRRATVAIASGRTLQYAGREWRFVLPKGRRIIRGKRINPVWVPPEWLYAEVALAEGLALRTLPPAGLRLTDGSRLVVRDSMVGLIRLGDTTFLALPIDEHLIFDGTVFIPPQATLNRQLYGELGAYALDLGDGYLLHGTRDPASIGARSTHGCIRLTDQDLAWLYAFVPVGVSVVIR